MCVLVRRLGHYRMSVEVWPLEPLAEIFRDELKLLDFWFRVPTATTAHRLTVKTKRGTRWRGKPALLKEGRQEQGPSPAQAVIGPDWRTAASNLAKPVVVNSLLAAYRLKRYLVAALGPGATSLGTTGVERSFWQHELRNKNRAGVWATNAMRQYRAVVAWKAEVQTAIRKQLHRVGRDTTTGLHAQQVLEAFVDWGTMLEGHRRVPLLLHACILDQPSEDMVNIGLDAFRHRLAGNLVEE